MEFLMEEWKYRNLPDLKAELKYDAISNEDSSDITYSTISDESIHDDGLEFE
jgi:hypothetical protein